MQKIHGDVHQLVHRIPAQLFIELLPWKFRHVHFHLAERADKNLVVQIQKLVQMIELRVIVETREEEVGNLDEDVGIAARLEIDEFNTVGRVKHDVVCPKVVVTNARPRLPRNELVVRIIPVTGVYVLEDGLVPGESFDDHRYDVSSQVLRSLDVVDALVLGDRLDLLELLGVPLLGHDAERVEFGQKLGRLPGVFEIDTLGQKFKAYRN